MDNDSDTDVTFKKSNAFCSSLVYFWLVSSVLNRSTKFTNFTVWLPNNRLSLETYITCFCVLRRARYQFQLQADQAMTDASTPPRNVPSAITNIHLFDEHEG